MKKKRPAEHIANTRPQPLTPGQLDGANAVEVVKHLLRISLRRLSAGCKLEEQRGIVYPETSVILRDCERLQRRLNELGSKTPAAGTPAPDDHAGSVTTAPAPAANSFWD